MNILTCASGNRNFLKVACWRAEPKQTLTAPHSAAPLEPALPPAPPPPAAPPRPLSLRAGLRSDAADPTSGGSGVRCQGCTRPHLCAEPWGKRGCRAPAGSAHQPSGGSDPHLPSPSLPTHTPVPCLRSLRAVTPTGRRSHWGAPGWSPGGLAGHGHLVSVWSSAPRAQQCWPAGQTHGGGGGARGVVPTPSTRPRVPFSYRWRAEPVSGVSAFPPVTRLPGKRSCSEWVAR